MYDIVFISYNEPKASIKFLELVSNPFLVNRSIIHVHGVTGIQHAHVEAAKQVSTKMFYVVDSDAEILPNFRFNLKLDPSEENIVHVWQSRNPINGLVYGYGGVKLLPRELTLNMDLNSHDMTTSISSRFKVIPKTSNITAFNTDPLSTWRSSFRECAKLASKIIIGQNDQESENRLNVWRFNQSNAPFAEYSRSGASAGHWYGTTYKDNPRALSKINDYNWLESEYYGHIRAFPPESFK